MFLPRPNAFGIRINAKIMNTEIQMTNLSFFRVIYNPYMDTINKGHNIIIPKSTMEKWNLKEGEELQIEIALPKNKDEKRPSKTN